MITRNRIRTLLTLAAMAMAIFAGPAQAGPLEGELGILTPGTLAGNNPATGAPWAVGDQYRFAFHTSATTAATSADIATYNAWVQGLANASTAYNIGADDGVTWKVIGSTSAVDARDNTSTNPTVDGSGHAIFLLDGSTVVANDYADLWDGEIQHIINLTEQGTEWAYWPWTGTKTDGTAATGAGGDGNPLGSTGEVGQGNASVSTNWIWRVWTMDPPGNQMPMYALSDPLVIVGLAASDPNPANGATDVCPKVVLSWKPGPFVGALSPKHKVLLSENFDDVNDGIGGVTQDPNRYPAVGTLSLDFGKTYYWRVDEANSTTVWDEGDVWQFTTEPFAYRIDANNITATASSRDSATTGPQNTVNGLGLDAGDLHSIEPTGMWLSGGEPQGAWIEYKFDNAYKLHQMWVWNHNTTMETTFGLGVKDATIQYSTNGTDYTTLGTTHEFKQAPGTADYEHNTEIDFGGAVARYVKITANSNWGGLSTKYGLSEVRFFYIPVQARLPQPTSGATGIAPDVVLNWRAGREAATHEVYLSSNRKDVVDGTAPVNTVTEASYGPLDLELGETYYWKVNEVNEAEVPTSWEGDIWNFTTIEYLAVDDFEDYDTGDNQIWFVWKDGIGYSDPAYPPSYPGNGTGSAVGDEGTNNYMEQTIFHGGSYSMPLAYDNSGAGGKLRYSEIFREWSVPQNWTTNGVKVLVVPFYGDPANAPVRLYVAVEDSTGNIKDVAYKNGDPDAVLVGGWDESPIPLADFTGVSLSSVKKLYFGVGNRNSPQAGGTGTLYIDDIGLYPSRCDLRKRSADFAKVDYIEDCVVDCKELELMAENWLAVSAATGIVPNGDFELMYKPGTAVTGVVSDGGWTQGVGPACPIDDGEYVFSDESTGTVADIPGWIGYDKEGWIALDGTYGRDQTTGNLQGSVSRQGNHTPDGLHSYLSNGGGWGNAAGGLIVSDAPLGNVENGIYTLSMAAQGDATPVVLELLAGGIALTPTSSVDPALTAEWQEFSRTYGSASLAGHIGEPLTIVLGVGRDAAGNQTRFDDVTLLRDSEPLPILPLAGRRVDLNDDKKVDFKDFAVLADSWLDEQLWP